MAASSINDVEANYQFARGYIEDMPSLGGSLVRAVGNTMDAKQHPDELQRLALALAEFDASLRSLNQSISEAAVARLMRQKTP